MKNLIPTALMIALSASPVFALSCIQPDAARMFTQAAESDKSFVILHGTFDFAARPEVTTDNPRAENYLTKFKGLLLTGNGFTDSVEAPVTVNTTCVASWCGKMSPDKPYLAFVEQVGRQLTLNVGPCPDSALQKPTDAMLKQIVACAKGDDCTPEG